jgi:hypothetical protein
MEAGVNGRLRIVMVLLVLLPMQLPALTDRFPDVQLALKLSCMVLVPCPLIMEVLAGIVQLYI